MLAGRAGTGTARDLDELPEFGQPALDVEHQPRVDRMVILRSDS